MGFRSIVNHDRVFILLSTLVGDVFRNALCLWLILRLCWKYLIKERGGGGTKFVQCLKLKKYKHWVSFIQLGLVPQRTNGVLKCSFVVGFFPHDSMLFFPSELIDLCSPSFLCLNKRLFLNEHPIQGWGGDSIISVRGCTLPPFFTATNCGQNNTKHSAGLGIEYDVHLFQLGQQMHDINIYESHSNFEKTLVTDQTS